MSTHTDKDIKCSSHRACRFRRLILLFLSITIIILDQISKWMIMEKITRPFASDVSFFQWYMQDAEIVHGSSIYITPFFNIVLAWNTGVSFSLFNQIGSSGPFILSAVALIIVCIFIYLLTKAAHFSYALGYALVIGGALGNVIDRLRFGAVIDFLDIHLYGYHWPAFNVADIAVVSGIGILIFASLFFDICTKERYRGNMNQDECGDNEYDEDHDY
ncbi:MAG: signal peptidase II [Alphaproteobacteria bacterium]